MRVYRRSASRGFLRRLRLVEWRFMFFPDFSQYTHSRVVSVLDSGAEGLGSNRSRDAVG